MYFRIWTVWRKKYGEDWCIFFSGVSCVNVPSEPERKALKEKALQFGARNPRDFKQRNGLKQKAVEKSLRLGKDTSAKDCDLKRWSKKLKGV